MASSARSHAPNITVAEDQVFANSLKLRDIWATRPDDRRLFVLLGSGLIRSLRYGDPATFISNWQATHPAARITPISRMLMTNRVVKVTTEIVYIWIEDGKHSLNVDMVKAGFFPGSAMYDMVDNQKRLDRLLDDPKLAAARAQVEKERADNPQDTPKRLVTDSEYR